MFPTSPLPCLSLVGWVTLSSFLFFKFLNIILFIYFWLCWVFVAAPGLFSSCTERGPLFVAVRGLLIVVASFAAEHGL